MCPLGLGLGNYGEFTLVCSVVHLLEAMQDAPDSARELLIGMLGADHMERAEAAGTLPPASSYWMA